MEDFWTQYNAFLPPWSKFRFGDEFASNLAGQTATLDGDVLPGMNAAAAQTGIQQFQIPGLDTGILGGPGFGTGPDAGTIAKRAEPTRFNWFLDQVGLGVLAIVLVAAGIIVLGLSSYKKVTGESVTDTIKSAAQGAA